MFIKIIIQINIIKIYAKNTQNVLQKNVALPESSSKKEQNIVCVKTSIKFFNHFTCDKPISNKFQCC